jgi:superfamily I DNA/RNA helicase
MELSAEQIAAVERSGQDVCVVAGPGWGKTRYICRVEKMASEHVLGTGGGGAGG